MFYTMPRRSGKNSSPQKTENSWLTQFFHEHNLPESLMEVLAEHHITSDSILTELTEQDFVDMELVVGQKVLLRRVIANLLKQPPSAVSLTAPVSRVASPLTEVLQPSSLLPFKLDEELAKIEAEFCNSKAAAPSNTRSHQSTEQVTTTSSSSSWNGFTGSEAKPIVPSDLIFGSDGKNLKPLQLTFAQFMLGNFKILESILSKNPSEATDYIGYLKFLAIKGTRFQTRAILAFDQHYRATKSRDNFSWGSNVDDLSA